MTLTVKRLKNWLLTRHFELSTKDLAATSLTQLKTPKTVSERSDFFFQFCIYWMILTMAFYAYVGEKVPWLIIHQLLPMSFVAVYKLNWQKIAFALIGCLFLALMTWHVAFHPCRYKRTDCSGSELRGYQDVMNIMDNSSQVVLASKDYWPLPWYYRGDRWNKIVFYGQVEDEKP